MRKVKLLPELTLKRKKSILGIIFTAPFTIGFFLFLFYPIIQSIIFSLNEMKITAEGFTLNYTGLSNYYQVIFIDIKFRRVFTETIVNLLRDIPSVLIFSFFIANILNQKFKGRILARIIFFLPVILSAEIVVKLGHSHYMNQIVGVSQSGVFDINEVISFFSQLKLPGGLLVFTLNAINSFADIIKSSGIQILIFLAALQSIPISLYEAADVEGATYWEKLWKITFPMISPLIIVNVVYTIIDTFASPDNELLTFIKESAWGGGQYGVSVAMSWIYFLFIIILLLFIILILSKNVYYES